MSKIIAFKLVSGEEILGALNEAESTSTVITLNEPVAFVMMQTKQGVRGTFMPYVQSAEEVEKLAFQVHHMTCLPFEVAGDVASAYIKAHSKIDLSAAPSTGLSLVKP